MTWAAFALAVLRALPALISFMTALKNDADARANQGIGYDQAVADTLKAGEAMMSAAHQVEDDAAKDHAKSDDTAFDPDFKRKA